ncbi:MAG TPA: translation factor Sua5, partial [Candidatus Avirikenella pullistercoris]|nr:translation factor Sua5 [Candidatus Avirikenella pullistercoris]
HFSEIADAIKQGVDKVVPVEYEGKPTGTPSSIIKLGTGSEVQVIRA